VQKLPQPVEGANADRLECAESAVRSAAGNTETQRKASKRSESKSLQQNMRCGVGPKCFAVRIRVEGSAGSEAESIEAESIEVESIEARLVESARPASRAPYLGEPRPGFL
jgi:hypothetical protein